MVALSRSRFLPPRVRLISQSVEWLRARPEARYPGPAPAASPPEAGPCGWGKGQTPEVSVSGGGKNLTMNCRFQHAWIEWGLFVLLAVLATFPLATKFTSHLPQGSESAATVPLLNLWTIWWNVDRLEHGYQDYWDAPIYYPAERMFAASEPQTAVGWLAWPLYKLLHNWAALYNCVVLFFLSLNGYTAYRLLRTLRLTLGASLGGGAMMVVLPLVHWQLGVLQLISVWGVLWMFRLLVRFRRVPNAIGAALLGTTYAVTYSLCCYYGLFLAVLLPVTLPLLLGRRLVQWSFWGYGSAAVLLAAVLLSPILAAQLQLARETLLEYPLEWYLALSALPTDYLLTPWEQWISLSKPGVQGVAERYAWPLCPGTLKIALAVAGIGYGIWHRRRRRITLWLMSLLILAFLLSLGPHLHESAYQVLADYVPGYGKARNLFRFAFFVQIVVVLFAASGLQGLERAWRTWGPNRWRYRTATCLVVVVALVLTGETWPRQPKLYELPRDRAESSWTARVKNKPAPVVLAFFPLPESNRADDLERTAEWMYFQMFHKRPMVNGYSTFVPEGFAKLKQIVEAGSLSELLGTLQRLGVTHVVCDLRAAEVNENFRAQDMAAHRVLRDELAGIEVWELSEE